MTQHDIFREIEEDIERQRYEALWRRYGPWIVGAAVAVVLATAIFSSWQSSRAEKSQKASGELIEILSHDDHDPAKQADALRHFAAANHAAVQGILAQLHAAALEAKMGNKDKAAQIYDDVAKNTSVDRMFRQFADLMWVRLNFDGGDPALLKARLQPLAAPDAPWHYSAQEYQGFLALRGGDKAEAKAVFANLSRDTTAPQSLRDRARAMARYMED